LDIYQLISGHLGYFLLIFTRVSGIFTTAPIFGSRNLPVYVKAGLSLIIAYILMPIVYSPSAAIPDQLLRYVFVVASEFLLGLILGWVCSLIFSAVQMAGQLLDMQIGFGIVNVIDPQFGQQVPLVGNFKYILALLIFLVTNGHHVFLSALFNSFKYVPVTGVIFHASLSELIVDMVFIIFITALKISLPVLVAILLTDVALGILAKTMPQMNIFVVGVPGKIFVGLFILALALPFYIAFLGVGFNAMYKDIYRILGNFQ
jgi:flagellar biosynthetic protein FliR